ncbi:unnamed protein product, partial [Heterosigma akashiwo]
GCGLHEPGLGEVPGGADAAEEAHLHLRQEGAAGQGAVLGLCVRVPAGPEGPGGGGGRCGGGGGGADGQGEGGEREGQGHRRLNRGRRRGEAKRAGPDCSRGSGTQTGALAAGGGGAGGGGPPGAVPAGLHGLLAVHAQYYASAGG